MIPLSDVKAYFTGGDWKGHWSGDKFEGSIGIADIKIKLSGKSYSVRIEAVDDPTDSEEMSTGEPLKAIADFLGQDIPGGEHFERMSSVPSFLAHSLAMAADLVGAGAVGRRAALRMLRRFSSFSPLAEAAPQRPGTDLSELEKDARRKGWKAKLNKDGYGDDILEIDVSGIYRATVELDAIMYEYKFELRGESQVDESGTTDDPIRELRRWAKSPEVDDARANARLHTRKRREEPTRRAPAEEPLS